MKTVTSSVTQELEKKKDTGFGFSEYRITENIFTTNSGFANKKIVLLYLFFKTVKNEVSISTFFILFFDKS